MRTFTCRPTFLYGLIYALIKSKRKKVRKREKFVNKVYNSIGDRYLKGQ